MITEEILLALGYLWLIETIIKIIIIAIIAYVQENYRITIKRITEEEKFIAELNEAWEKDKMKMMLEFIRNSYKLRGELSAKKIDTFQYRIYLNYKYFGIFDRKRNTFVD